MILFAAMMFSAFQLNAVIPSNDGDDPETIELTQQNGGEENPNSLNPVFVSAYKTSTTVVVEISGYSGNVVAAIWGTGGNILSDNNPIYGSGQILMNISSLPTGTYTLYIFLNNKIYSGSFSK